MRLSQPDEPLPPKLVDAHEFVGLQRTGEAFDLEVCNRTRLNAVLERSEDALAEQDLPWACLVAQPSGEIRDGAESAIVVSSFEPDPAERCVPHRNAGAEAEVVAALAPAARELPDPVSHRQRELRRLYLV